MGEQTATDTRGRPESAAAADAQPVTRAPRGSQHRPGALRRIWRWCGSKWGVRILAWSFLLVLWQLVAWWAGPQWTPTVQATLGALGDVFQRGYHLTLLTSLGQMFAGFFLTMIIAIPVGIAMGRSKVAAGLLGPWVTNLFSAPKEALLPLLIILFGTGFEYRVSVVVLFSVFFLVMNTSAGVRYADASLMETAVAFRTPPVRMVTRVLIPAAAPFIVAGMRLGLGMSLKAMIIAELWVSFGTGGLIDQVGAQRDLPMFYALSLLIIVVAAAISESLLILEKRLRRSAGVES